MKAISPLWNHDDLIKEVSQALTLGLKRHKVPELKRATFTNQECLLSALSVFTFKYPSLLQFDDHLKKNHTLSANLKTLFNLKALPSDTQMRTRLDSISPEVIRPAFTRIFSLLQRSKILQHYRFIDDSYLISLDGTQVFSSHAVYCDNCCVKQHRNGDTTYYHHLLGAALVHPDHKEVFPLAPEPIQKSDGQVKNDCERNATKRWIQAFKREHPHLKVTILADGLASNEPFITMLRAHNLGFIIVCKESDHRYLTDWVNAIEEGDKVRLQTNELGVISSYEYMDNIPLNDAKQECLVNVVRFSETQKGKTTRWMWVTSLSLTKKELPHFVKGARTRWKIENETFNTLKNQGYEFEHNFGHGKNTLHTVFSFLMMLTFLIDQCLQKVNKAFQKALEKARIKKTLWQDMLSTIKIFIVPNFTSLYYAIADPPKIHLPARYH